MPIYTFRCDKCHEETDKLRPMGDESTLACACGGTARQLDYYRVRSILQGAGVIPASEPEYQLEADKKALKRDKDWDGDRAVEHIRNNLVENPDGGRRLDMNKALGRV